MNNGPKERFKEELWAQTDPHATEELNKELNKMGKMQDVVQKGEAQESGDFSSEEQRWDAAVRGKRERSTHEDAILGQVIDAIYDLDRDCKIDIDRRLGEILKDFESKEKVEAIAESAAASSQFSGNPGRLIQFATGMRGFISRGVFSLDMPLREILGVLEEKYEKDSRVDELERRDSLDRGRRQLMDLCTFIQNAPRDLIKKYQAKRTKRFSTARTSGVPAEDTLWITIKCDDDVMDPLLDKLDSIPKRIVTKERGGLTFEAPFQKRFLDEAQGFFKWIKSE
jgi:hypothetical protein